MKDPIVCCVHIFLFAVGRQKHRLEWPGMEGRRPSHQAPTQGAVGTGGKSYGPAYVCRSGRVGVSGNDQQFVSFSLVHCLNGTAGACETLHLRIQLPGRSLALCRQRWPIRFRGRRSL